MLLLAPIVFDDIHQSILDVEASLRHPELERPTCSSLPDIELQSTIISILNPKQLLQAYLKAEEELILTNEEYDLLTDAHYARLISGACHNSTLWASKQLIDSLPTKDLSKFSWASGSYKTQIDLYFPPLNSDHSWLTYQANPESPLFVIDLTLSQFHPTTIPRLFIGLQNSRFNTYGAIPLTATKEQLIQFAFSL